jgi:flagellar P-ring protein precursor FlgI
MRILNLRSGLLLAAAVLCVPAASASAATAPQGDALRIKDIGKMSGWRDNALTGYGLVTGLAGTGDSARNKTTRQSIANMLARFDLTIAADDVQSRNVAAVMVTAVLSPFARAGDAVDVTVTSIGDARSLVGGALMLAPLKGPDGKIYGLAQGPLSVGGYKYDMNGNVVQKNHPTVASIPSGATVEVGVHSEMRSERNTVTFVLAEPDYTTASRVAAAINARMGAPLAVAQDAGGVEIAVPDGRRARLADFLTDIENVMVEPDRRARVVINERTGTIVSGGDVRISRVAVSHGDLRVSIVTDNSVSQPLLVRQVGPGVESVPVSNSRVSVDERSETGYVGPDSTTVADLVQSLARLKTNTRDIIAILRGVKAAGALHADLIVQ